MTDKNIEYELFVKEVYETIINNEGYKNLTVDHNVRINGKSGCYHQIDVYWELRIAGEIKRFAIECKNYSKTIQISKVRDFFGVIHDIGDIKGIMVTKKGFQSGAKSFADFYGISLKEIRKPKKNDWDGKVRKTQFKIILQDIKIKDVKLNLDESWLINNMNPFKKSEIKIPSDVNEKVVIYKEDGSKDFDLREMEERIPRQANKAYGLKYEFDFSSKLRFVDTSIGKVKVYNIVVNYDENPISTELTIDAFAVTDAIFKDAQSGEIKFIRKNKLS